MTDVRDDPPTGECIPVEELADVLERGADDPRRAHVKSCLRCRSLAIELRSFLAGAVPLPGQDDAAAERRLGAVLRREVLGQDPVVRVPASRWRPILAAAAVLVVALLSVRVLDRPADDGAIVLRGESGPETEPFRGRPTATIVERGGTVLVEFRWEAQEGADGYRLLLQTARLDSLAAMDTREPVLSWKPTDLDEPLPSGTPVLWRVVAMRGGSESARSPIHILRLP